MAVTILAAVLSSTKMKSILKSLITACVLFTTASAMSAGPGAQYFTRRIHTTKDAAALPAEAKVAMACTKCKTITVFEPIASHKVFLEKEKHACPGCSGEITMKLTGTAPENRTMTHSCSKCGDESAYCCAMSPADGPTRGMGGM
jgi:hypothetical protein